MNFTLSSVDFRLKIQGAPRKGSDRGKGTDVLKELPRNRGRESPETGTALFITLFLLPCLQLCIPFSAEPGAMPMFSKHGHLLNGEVRMLGFSRDMDQIRDTGTFVSKELAHAVLEVEKSQDQNQRLGISFSPGLKQVETQVPAQGREPGPVPPASAFCPKQALGRSRLSL